MIPKILHAIWLGPKPISERNQLHLEIRRRLFPHWQLKLWTDKEAAEFSMINRASFERAKQPAQRGDILRLELLYQFGGVTADLDFEFLKPLDPLLENVECFCGRQNTGRLLPYAPGLMGAVPQQDFIRAMMDGVPAGMERKERIHRQTGPGLLLRTMIAHPKRCHVFPKELFYPESRDAAGAYAFHVGDHAWR